MSRTIPAITPTEEQWEIIDSLYDPYVKEHLYNKKMGLFVYDIKEDEYVRLYIIKPDGRYCVQELIDPGFGWRDVELV